MSKTTNKFSPEVRERAVRLVLEQQRRASSRWAAIGFDCGEDRLHAETLRDWVRKAESDNGKRAGVTTDVAEKLKTLERENRELQRANEILRKASAYFAQAELDRRLK